ncbi:hypothetical protein [Streptomyces sp. NRRL B-24085]|uniref:hypothetical protein n=1 Tax=Streptomyces sp. NRRL B-24085 TaxID=1709476 RepID=UPI0006B39B7C|nr:hypothetical protein [Streptomyces sp. NRRL B-24085]
MSTAAPYGAPVAGVLLGTLVLVAGLFAGVMLLRNGRLRRRSTSAVFFVTVLVCAALAGMAVRPGGSSKDTAEAGVPVRGSVQLGARQVPVLVVPNRPGFNLVAVDADEVSVGTTRDRLTPGEPRPGSRHTWAGVTLPAGRSSLWVSAGGLSGSLTVDTGDDTGRALPALRGADGPECASSALGALAAGVARPLTTCPADRLSTADTEALRATVKFVAQRGERALALVADESPRGTAAAAVIRAAADREGISISATPRAGHPLVIVSGWQGADSALRDVAAGRSKARGAYLAPWLLTTPLLQPAAGQVLPLRYAPRSDQPMRYVADLARLWPSAAPTAAGYESWLSARDETTHRSPVLLYAASVARIPGSSGTGGHHGTARADWLPEGLITPVSGVLRAS